MKKVAIIYWSGTGNTEAMANAMAQGAEAAGAEVKTLVVGDASIEDVKSADAVALGCPSMGAEVLEEEEMEPFVESLAGEVGGKTMILFGSYGWGNGEWMDDWKPRMEDYGAQVIDTLILNETPDDEGLESCKELGQKLAK